MVPSKGTDKDWTYRDSVSGGALRAIAAPPTSVDLRQGWWAINDQEDTGSCVGWATADGVVRYHMVKANMLSSIELQPQDPRAASFAVDLEIVQAVGI